MIMVGVHKLRPEAILPIQGTSMSSCFDLSACCSYDQKVTVYSSANLETKREWFAEKIFLFPGDRMLVPTGLIMKIKESVSVENFTDIYKTIPLNQYSIRLHPRSGLSIKKGISLINCEGIVDVDYQKEIFIPIVNLSSITVEISHGDRIAQMEVVVNCPVKFYETKDVTPYSERDGGFGSTGK